jgi:hypothetical protein
MTTPWESESNNQVQQIKPQTYGGKNIMVLGLMLLVLGLILGYIWKDTTDRNLIDGYKTTLKNAIKAQNNTLTEDTDLTTSNSLPQPNYQGEFKTYRSNNLGIVFNYYQYASGDSVKDNLIIKEVGNKVHLYVNHTNSEDEDIKNSKYIEVLTKNSNDSLTDAIKATILKNSNLDECEILPYDNKTRQILSPGYQMVKIIYKVKEGTPQEDIMEKASLCNREYTQFSGRSYFVMDEGHPDKFAFVKLGQDNFAFPVLSTENSDISWDMTLRFIR